VSPHSSIRRAPYDGQKPSAFTAERDEPLVNPTQDARISLMTVLAAHAQEAVSQPHGHLSSWPQVQASLDIGARPNLAI
jgi:hypothetical protein